jgi:hypothetical protein
MDELRDTSGIWTPSRRELLAGGAASLFLPSLADAQAARPGAMPGPFRGRVLEVIHPGSVVNGKASQSAVNQMMKRGMVELTGEATEAAAWKRFFGPGDTVGVKGCPVGAPKSISQLETLREVYRGLMLAGVKAENIVHIERYEKEMGDTGFEKALPKGARWAVGSVEFDGVQVKTDGYDTSVYAEFPWVATGADASIPAHRRSHVSIPVSLVVNKIVNVCVLKDHASAGITMALKNMSHGFSNNVARSHNTAAENRCDVFIPTVVALKPIREKVVLHIGDALIATYDGGPGVWNQHFRTWERKSLFFATDPVAMDRVGWDLIDKKRAQHGLPGLAQVGIKAKNPGFEQFDRRQPEHVLIAGKMGLGEADLAKIKYRRIEIG